MVCGNIAKTTGRGGDEEAEGKRMVNCEDYLRRALPRESGVAGGALRYRARNEQASHSEN